MKDHKIEALRTRIIKERHGSILLIGIGFGIAAVLFWGMTVKPMAAGPLLFLFALLMLGVGGLGLASFFSHTKLLRQLSNLKQCKEKPSITEKTFYRPRVQILYRTEKPYGYNSHISYYHCYAVTLFDETRTPYYYFLPVEIHNVTKQDIARIEEKFYRSIAVQCYEGTTLIQTIENDPYFMRMRDY